MKKSKKKITDGDKFDKMKARSSKKLFKTKKNKHKMILKNYTKSNDYDRIDDIDELENLN
jgi:hypothetical protein